MQIDYFNNTGNEKQQAERFSWLPFNAKKCTVNICLLCLFYLFLLVYKKQQISFVTELVLNKVISC